jgi:hypothetical protein
MGHAMPSGLVLPLIIRIGFDAIGVQKPSKGWRGNAAGGSGHPSLRRARDSTAAARRNAV